MIDVFASAASARPRAFSARRRRITSASPSSASVSPPPVRLCNASAVAKKRYSGSLLRSAISRSASSSVTPMETRSYSKREFRPGRRHRLARHGVDALAERNADAHRAHDHRQRVGKLRVERVAPALLAPMEDETAEHHPGHRNDQQRPRSGENASHLGHGAGRRPERCPARSTSAADNARHGPGRSRTGAPPPRSAASIGPERAGCAASHDGERIRPDIRRATVSSSRSWNCRRCFCSPHDRADADRQRRPNTQTRADQQRAAAGSCFRLLERGGPGAVEPEIRQPLMEARPGAVDPIAADQPAGRASRPPPG